MLLGGYAAKRCARRVHNDNDPTLADLQLVEVSAAAATRMAAGVDFEERIRDLMRAELGEGCVDLSGVPYRDRVAATSDAVAAGVPVILGGAIPDDVAGRRRGLPDILFRAGDRPDGSPGYLPGDIKNHRVLATTVRAATLCAPLGNPGPAGIREVDDRVERTGYQFDDLVQLAHYYRMLQASGWVAPGPPLVGVIGAGADDDPANLVLWRSLDDPIFRTYSRTAGTKLRSALARYDHEFAFRLNVVDVAQLRDGSPDQPEPLVRPVIVKECDNCPWYDYCLDEVGADDAAANTMIYRLDTREWLALHRLGFATIDEVAALSIDDPRLDAYWPEVTHQRKARDRLAGVIERAQMRVEGVWFRRTSSGPIEVPRADVEVDFDIEWDPQMAIYLWGFVVNDRASGESTTTQFRDWGAMDTAGRTAIAKAAIGFLTELAQQCAQADRSLAIYHYAPVEIGNVKRLIEELASPDLPTVDEWVDFTNRYFCDLLPIVKRNFVGVAGHGLKKIATYGAGFSWRDDDPGGLQSQDWLIAARGDGDSPEINAAQQRILEYNEDDVRATATLRTWLTTLR